MAGMKKAEIWFGPNGEIELETFGFKGSSCKEASEFLENALGTSGDTKKKMEWHLRNDEAVRYGKKHYGIDTSKLCG